MRWSNGRGFAQSSRADEAPTWNELLPLYAELQIELIEDADELLALGAPDKRPATVLAAYPELVGRVGRPGTIDAGGLRALAPS